MIVTIMQLEVIVETCDIIGTPNDFVDLELIGAQSLLFLLDDFDLVKSLLSDWLDKINMFFLQIGTFKLSKDCFKIRTNWLLFSI